MKHGTTIPPVARARPPRPAWLLAVLCTAAATTPVTRGARADTLGVDGAAPLQGQLVSVSADGVVMQTPDGKRKQPLQEVTDIRIGTGKPASLMAEKGLAVIVGAAGSRIGVGRDLAIEDGVCSLVTGFDQAVRVPIARVAAILLPTSYEQPADVKHHLDSLKLERGATDTLLVGPDLANCMAVNGVLLSLDKRNIVMAYQGMEAPMPAATVRAIVPALERVAIPTNRLAVLHCLDGSELSVTSLTAGGDGFTVGTPDLGELRVPRAASGLLAFRASSATPTEELALTVNYTPFFDDQVTWKRNRSVWDRPLQCGGDVYDEGIGVLARSEIRIPLKGACSEFAAVVGIADEMPLGSAVVSVLVDGKTAVDSVALNRSKPPRTLKVPTAGAQELAILVDFAKDTFGVGAAVNICAPTLKP
jgi:hypothetical protein